MLGTQRLNNDQQKLLTNADMFQVTQTDTLNIIKTYQYKIKHLQ